MQIDDIENIRRGDFERIKQFLADKKTIRVFLFF
jgi:hypothetical protein